MTKISDLTALSGSAVDDAADLLTIVDMSETGVARNKKITIDETRIALGLSSADSPQFTAINLGHASDTTITRASAGVVAIEGVNIVTTAGGVTFAADISVPDEAYDATAWNGSLEVPTKNAVRDKIESLSAGGAIEALDEGVSLTATMTSIDFVGAGVTATNTGGAVTVTIAGGGGYSAENARDDIGAALVAGKGVAITVDDGADTITVDQAVHGAMVRKSVDQTAANYSAGANIAWDQEVYDTGSFHDNVTNNTRLTTPAGANYVQVGCNLRLVNVTAASTITIIITKSGATTFDGAASYVDTNGVTNPRYTIASGPIPVTGGTDYFEVSLTCTDASIDITASVSNFWMMVVG